MQHHKTQKNLNFLSFIIAHRGASGNAPENTLYAFEKASKEGAQWVEFDVQITSCGTLVVFHDSTIDRTTNGHGFLSDKNYDNLKSYDASSWFSDKIDRQHIPTLEEVLDCCQKLNLAVNVEIKACPEKQKEIVLKITSLLKSKNYNLSFLFSSQDLKTMGCLKDLLPEYPRGIIIDEKLPQDWERLAQKYDCYSLHLSQNLITSELINAVKKKYKILTYTVNDEADAKAFFDMGVDAIFTNYPKKIDDYIQK